MIKNIVALVLVLLVGVVVGLQLPRGATLIATISSLGGGSNNDYAALKSNQAFEDYYRSRKPFSLHPLASLHSFW